MANSIQPIIRGTRFPLVVPPPTVDGVAVNFTTTAAFIAFIDPDGTYRKTLKYVPGGVGNDGTLNGAGEVDFSRTGTWTRDPTNLPSGSYRMLLFVGPAAMDSDDRYDIGAVAVENLPDGSAWSRPT